MFGVTLLLVVTVLAFNLSYGLECYNLSSFNVHICFSLAAMVNLTESMCWKAVARTVDSNRIGFVIYQKPVSYSCYKNREENTPPLCDGKNNLNSSW